MTEEKRPILIEIDGGVQLAPGWYPHSRDEWTSFGRMIRTSPSLLEATADMLWWEAQRRQKEAQALWPLLQGDTYAVKEQLKALGGIFDKAMRGWRMPPAAYDEARALVENCAGQMGFEEI